MRALYPRALLCYMGAAGRAPVGDPETMEMGRRVGVGASNDRTAATAAGRGAGAPGNGKPSEQHVHCTCDAVRDLVSGRGVSREGRLG